jgi:hypothetical protein
VFDEGFDDPTMSPRHAEILRQGAGTVVHDLGGGIRLNGAIVLGSHTLVEGDVLRIGDTVLVYTSEGGTPVTGEERVPDAPELTGATLSIEAVRRSIQAVAPHPRTVVVTGETGTGKEVVARMIHRYSARRGPFLAVNCGGFTEGLLASELFGHVRGAFTGAVSEQHGLFRAASGGTLLLDEAGDVPLALQPTLLRVLETWEIRPVGSSRDVPVDVRVVAASNRELVTMVKEGLFRADLYARLAQWVIRLPPATDAQTSQRSLAPCWHASTAPGAPSPLISRSSYLYTPGRSTFAGSPTCCPSRSSPPRRAGHSSLVRRCAMRFGTTASSALRHLWW